MWRVEVMSIGEHLDGEVPEDARQPLGHPGVVVGMAPTAEREPHRPVESPQRVKIEVRGEEGPQERMDPGRSLDHPRGRRSGRWGHEVDAGSDLQ